MNDNLTKSPGAQQALAGALMFALPFLSLVTSWGVGLCSFIFFLAALANFRESRAALVKYWPQVWYVLAAFCAWFLLALLLLALRPEMGARGLERPLRMFLCFTAMLVVLHGNPDRRTFWGGVVAGAAGAALMVTLERFTLDIDRPGGEMNAITAGDLLALLALLALAGMQDVRGGARAVLAAGALAGIAGALVTGTRGCLVALVLGVLVLAWQLRATRWARAMLAAFVVLAAAVWLVPATGVQERARQGVQDIVRYTDDNVVYSHLGLRLELWRAAGLLIAERPLLGAGRTTVRPEMEGYVKQGVLHPEALPPVHFHNDALQVLVFSGVAGLLAWLATLVAPFVFFERSLRHGGPVTAPALAGILTVTSYFAFGLTEVIFWSVKASMLYALLVFMLMGLCLGAKEQDGK